VEVSVLTKEVAEQLGDLQQQVQEDEAQFKVGGGGQG
jgi:hypothetical protein